MELAALAAKRDPPILPKLLCAELGVLPELGLLLLDGLAADLHASDAPDFVSCCCSERRNKCGC